MAMAAVPSLNTHVHSLAEDPDLSQYIKKEKERPHVPYNKFSKDIPVISIANLSAMGGDERVEAIAEIMKACREWGMFQVIDHGVSAELVEKMVEHIHQFFGLPAEEKIKYRCEATATSKFRGYAYGTFVKGDPLRDWRELFVTDVLPLASRTQHVEWPPHPPQLRETVVEYGEEMLRLAELLVDSITEGLGLEAKAIKEACGEIEERVLLNYYPACPQPELTLGVRRHTDIGTITLLHQDHVGGLQATKDGENWVTVEPLKGAFVVNLGDHMNVLSNNQLKSAEHRVAVNSSLNRVTITTFFNPAPDSIVRPLLQDDKQLPFEPCSFTDFYKRKLPQKGSKQHE